MGELADLAKQRSPFLKLENGECIVASYKSFKMIPSTYDPDKEVFRFILETDFGTKYWDTGSNKVAIVFDTCAAGDKVKICKKIVTASTGKEQTSWLVEKLDKDGKAIKPDEQPAPEEESQDETDRPF
jgi:hypothetical protein